MNYLAQLFRTSTPVSFQKLYPMSNVKVTLRHSIYKRTCVSELEIPYALKDIKQLGSTVGNTKTACCMQD